MIAADRELLELAARAARLHLVWNRAWDWYVATNRDSVSPPKVNWDPITDDGDALRLALALGLRVEFRPLAVCVWRGRKQFNSYGSDDGIQPTHARRAIVYAAAEIGREMMATDATVQA